MELLLAGDCGELLKGFPDGCVNLIVTSPPYGDAREGGIDPDRYVDWFLPKAAEFQRVLASDGTFILNIKERVVEAERHTYVLELILALRQQGWLWTEEFLWHKRTSHPGKWPNRFRGSWERLLQFNRSKRFAMYQDSVMEPIGSWATPRLKRLGKNDVQRRKSGTGGPFGTNFSHWEGRDKVYPTNVLHLAGETGNVGHNSAFPLSIPDWFIRLFTREGDLVLDPFMGSGTTLQAARALGRNAIGIDILPQNVSLALARLHPRPEVSIFNLENKR